MMLDEMSGFAAKMNNLLEAPGGGIEIKVGDQTQISLDQREKRSVNRVGT